MPTPSLTLARRLYAKKHGIYLGAAYASVTACHSNGTRYFARVWDAFEVVHEETETYARTEQAALRKLCRALGWKP